MDEQTAQKIREEANRFFSAEPNLVGFEEDGYEYTEEEWENLEQLCFFVQVKNNNKGLHTLVGLRNKIYNAHTSIQVHTFLEEQVADQILDNEEYLSVDFYISRKTMPIHYDTKIGDFTHEMAHDIVNDLSRLETISIDNITSECTLGIEDIKGEIERLVFKELKLKNINVED